jgi:hypothetical protein
MTVFFANFINSNNAAGDIATILTATAGVVIMLNLRMPRPLLVVVAAAVSLWGLTRLTSGLDDLETVAWSALLYGLAYFAFFWLNRYKRTIPVLMAIIAIVIIVRLTITL